jgi:phosphoadenosine phosphosulfate reductase
MQAAAPCLSSSGANEAWSDADLFVLNNRFERASAAEIVRWAVDRFHSRLCLAASMTDAVLIDIAARIEPGIEVVFIDTGYHFPETLQTVEAVRARYDLNLRVLSVPRQDPPAWLVDPRGCCSQQKVAQLDRALADKEAWMSGLRRVESPARAHAPVVDRDRRGLLKLNPIATWSDDDVRRYVARNDVPVNPLVERGYPSIGCQPCTRAVAPGEDQRAGRWSGQAKTECGLHL